MTQDNQMTDTPEAPLKPCPFCGGPARIVIGGPGLHYVRCEACNAASDDCSKDRAYVKWNTRHPTGNPYIDLDVGSITVPIGYVRKMVEAMQNTVDRGYVSSSIDEERGDHEALVAALKLGQSVITAFDQEAERG